MGLIPRAGLAVGVTVLVLGLAGCSGEPSGTSPEPMVHRVEGHGGAVVMTVTPSRPTVADQIRLTLMVEVDEGVEVGFPDFDGTVGDFTLVSAGAAETTLLESGRVRATRTSVIEPFLAGTYDLPAAMVVLTRPEGNESQSLETPQVSLEVSSIVGDDEAAALRGIAPPEDPPVWKGRVGYALLIGGVLLAAATMAIFWMRRRREPTVEPTPSAHLLAYRQLDRIQAAGYLQRGQISQFYLEVSGVLRQYIERRFTLHAPEQTTEEFLEARSTTQVFSPGQHTMLRKFLTHCDMVKFARHAPERAQIDETFSSCRAFIDVTKQEESDDV